MSEFAITKASRQSVKPLIGLFSESGCGKTYSSLLLARGFVGPAGKVVMIDTESGRGSLYADVLPGGYEVLSLGDPFSPDRVVKAIQAVEQSGASIGILDSASHSWDGLGGVLDMATASEERSGKSGLHNWRQPKLEHAKMMLKLLQSSIPWIVCLRAKHKTRQVKNERGKTEIVKDDFTTPIQADDYIFELTCHAEVMQDHSIRLTKCSHPKLRECFPKTGPITEETGRLIAAWCASGGQPQPTVEPPKPQAPAVATEAQKAKFITSLEPIRREACEYYSKIGLPLNALEDLPLSEVPTTQAQFKSTMSRIEAFCNGQPATR